MPVLCLAMNKWKIHSVEEFLLKRLSANSESMGVMWIYWGGIRCFETNLPALLLFSILYDRTELQYFKFIIRKIRIPYFYVIKIVHDTLHKTENVLHTKDPMD